MKLRTVAMIFLAAFTITMFSAAAAQAEVWLFCHAPDWQYPYKHYHKQNGVHTDYKCRPTDSIGIWYWRIPPW